jgi:hypothetical protein
LAAHAGEAIDQTGDQEFPGAIDDSYAFGDRQGSARTDGDDVSITDVYDRVWEIIGGMAPVCDIDDCAAGEDESGYEGRLRGLVLCGRAACSGSPKRTEKQKHDCEA